VAFFEPNGLGQTLNQCHEKTKLYSYGDMMQVDYALVGNMYKEIVLREVFR
jgi:hypothetical protein